MRFNRIIICGACGLFLAAWAASGGPALAARAAIDEIPFAEPRGANVTPHEAHIDPESPDPGHAHEAGHKKGLPQLDPAWYPSQIFWLAVSFATLYVFFSKITLPKIGQTLSRRRSHIEHDIAMAQTLRQSAEEARARYESAVADAQMKSTALYMKAQEEIKAKTAAAMDGFKTRAAARIQETERAVEKAKKDAMEGIQTAAAEIASYAAQKIVGVRTDIGEAQVVVRNLNNRKAA